MRRYRLRGWWLGWLALAAVAGAVAEPTSFDEAGYRKADYRAPLPDRAPGATTLDVARLQHLIERQAPVLIDVYAALMRPDPTGFDSEWLVSRPRLSLPGAVWLPNVGYAEVSARVDRYFRANLARQTRGDPERPVVIFCVVDCWMSWNAVKRAASYGYRRLYWLPEGTDGWQAAGLPLEPVSAEPLPAEAP